MTKVLWPRTIIPAELYVERKADKQLAQIMSDMGRPGYILVARQMGKTNLLINAKRKYSTGSNIIVYIDLSNRYETDRLCFRSIIDTILSTNEDKLGHLIEKIHADRETRKIPAYTEHSAELRLILDSITDKLIIILDEIDSLTAADYSDKIFAQIRSVYFERVNFSCLERLTYVLSGVAEPSDIIKDKSISPFNIGQRIVLGDFDYTEYRNFILKTKINISPDVMERIFYWTNGNPRMTWDICSEVEDLLVDGRDIQPDNIDDIVDKTYLTNFDSPPVDHIRTLVESSQELRDGVIAILYGKDNSISDEVKSRLYLAGILDSKFSEGIIRIKNKIIEKSLDESWLESINNKEIYSQSNADIAYREGRFLDAIEQYSHLLMDNRLNEVSYQAVCYRLALSYFYTRDYEKSVEYFDKYTFDKKNYKAVYINGIYTKSICQLALQKNVDEAIKNLDDIRLDTDITDEHHWLSSIMILFAANKYKDVIPTEKTTAIFNSITQDDGNIKNKDIISLTYLMAGDNENEPTRSINYYKLSIENANGLEKVKPYLNSINIDQSSENYKTVSRLLIENPDSSQFLYETPLKTFNVGTFLEYIDYSLVHGHKEVLISVFNAFIENKNDLAQQNEIFPRVVLSYANTSNNIEHKTFLYEYLLEKGRTYIISQVIFEAARQLLFVNPSSQESGDIYFTGFQNYVEGRPDYIDIFNFKNRIQYCINSKEPSKAFNYSTLLLDNVKNLNEVEQVSLLYIYYLRMVVSNGDEQKKGYEKITKLLSIIDSHDYLKDFYPSKVLRKIKADSTVIYRKSHPIKTVRHAVKFGRNQVIDVVYRNGDKAKGKYKSFHDDIVSKRCVILEDEAI